ncbi:MAG: hypothetical protein AMXMBFR7_27470 [Planctomycetota bacterium]
MLRAKVGCVVLWVLLCGVALAEETAPKALDDAGRQKAAGLLKDLGHDDFATREDAEKGLRALGLPALPLLKDALAKTDDTEVRLRLERLVNDLALEAETDPDKLAALARRSELVMRYDMAINLYERAAAKFRERAILAPTGNQALLWSARYELAMMERQRLILHRLKPQIDARYPRSGGTFSILEPVVVSQRG